MEKVGEYGRTNKGKIFRFAWILNDKNERIDNCIIIFEKDGNRKYYLNKDEQIIKHSKDIVDVIEVKDLIKFSNKLPNSLEDEEMIIHIFNEDTLKEVKTALKNKEIEIVSIVTHKQFSQVEYEV